MCTGKVTNVTLTKYKVTRSANLYSKLHLQEAGVSVELPLVTTPSR